MICRNCGAEISDRAIVCYRCGTPTETPEPATRGSGRTRSRLIPIVAAFAIVVIGALYMSMAVRGDAPPLVYWLMLGLAMLVVVWRLASRR